MQRAAVTAQPTRSTARPGLKSGYFVLEGLNSFGTVYFSYYFYFFMQKAYGFSNRSNLVLAAVNAGAVYALGAWQAGKFAQRFGYLNALKTGFLIMLTSTALGLEVHSAPGHILVMGGVVLGMCFTWPTLEALVSEGESRHGLQKMVGIYNVVWSATAAVANFSGGAMLQKWGFRSLFYVPMAVQATQLLLTLWLDAAQRKADGLEAPAQSAGSSDLKSEVSGAPPDGVGLAKSRCFLRMAWLANPFAYIAINTLIAVVPGVANRLHLSTMLAGFCCSVWCFARLGAFVGLWFWSGWHYRFGWLLGSFVALIVSFASILTAGNLEVLVLAQVTFGGALGLIYYSSLFYSMNASDTKGEHGGIHEAVIGLGNFAGPAVGAASLYLFPQYANSGTFAVSFLLLCGLGGLVTIWKSAERETTG